MDEKKLEELKKQTAVDNSRLEEVLKKEHTPEMQIEFFELLRQSQLYLPVAFSADMFEGIENAKEGDVFETTGREGFNINYLTDGDGNKVVPLFTSDEAMEEAEFRSSVMVMFASDLVDMLKQSDRYSAVAINPFTANDAVMPIEVFLGLFDEPSDEEKQFFESLMGILEMLEEDSYELEDKMAFVFRGDDNFMKDEAADGVFVLDIPLTVSTDLNYRENLKYTNILLLNKGDKVLPLGKVPKDEPDTIVAPKTEFKIVDEPDEFTTVWMCMAQPFYESQE